MTGTVSFAARSDVGRVRTGNEDSYLARPPVFAVADGMGGHQAGEVASALAIELITQSAGEPGAPGADSIVGAIERSNSAIRAEARQRPDLDGMGTTCTVAVVSAGEILMGHVGDSRAYRFRGGQLVQLTEDHSLVASMVREGIIDPDEAFTDGRRNIITRALGAEDTVRVDLVTATSEPGDRLLLCSDGLSSQITNDAIAAVLAAEPDPDRAADRLVALANDAGGEDNVTVIVIDVDRVAALMADLPGSAAPTMLDLAPAAPPATSPVAPPAVKAAADGRARRSMRGGAAIGVVTALVVIVLGLRMAAGAGSGATPQTTIGSSSSPGASGSSATPSSGASASPSSLPATSGTPAATTIAKPTPASSQAP